MQVEELINSPQKLLWDKKGSLRKTSFLYYLLKKRTIYHESCDNLIETASCLDKMITVLNSNFKENWNFYLEKLNGIERLNLIIYFPKVKITNTRLDEHNFNHLLVRFVLRIENNTIKLHQYSGCRLQRDLTEEQKEYSHSHLPSSTRLGEFRDFCYAETEVRDLQTMFNAKFDINLFDLLLQTIKTYVSHESLEGVPYKHISHLTYNMGTSNSLEPLTFSYEEEIYECIFKEMELTKLKFNLDRNNVIKVDRESLAKELKEKVLEVFDTHKVYFKDIFVNKKINPLYYYRNLLHQSQRSVYNEISTTDSSLSNTIRFKTNNRLDSESTRKFFFRGKEIKIKNYTTIEHRNYAEESTKKEIYEKGEIRELFIERIKRSIEKELNKKRKNINSSF